MYLNGVIGEEAQQIIERAFSAEKINADTRTMQKKKSLYELQ